MARFETLNLIRVFDFYLAAMLLLGLYRRWSVYRDTGSVLLMFAVGRRWPRLLGRMNAHKGLILNWPTLRPLALAILLMLIQMIASRLIWPQANLTAGDLAEPWWEGPIFLVALIPMMLMDVYFLVRVGEFDRTETLKYFDKAESWAGTWRSKAVRTATLGKVDPDRMVDDQVKEGLKQLGQTVSQSMWWVAGQVGLRLAFGLTIWILWAMRMLQAQN